MKFCPVCQRCMSQDTSSGEVVFICVCGEQIKGTPRDIRISGKKYDKIRELSKYTLLIENAAFDRTNQLVNKVCSQCKRDYMTQIRVGDAEIIIYKCKCGHEEK